MHAHSESRNILKQAIKVFLHRLKCMDDVEVLRKLDTPDAYVRSDIDSNAASTAA